MEGTLDYICIISIVTGSRISLITTIIQKDDKLTLIVHLTDIEIVPSIDKNLA